MIDASVTEFANDIDAWVECEIGNGESVPDFWDELDTSDRLAKYLVMRGYQKVRQSTGAL